MAPLIAYPHDARSFPFANRMLDPNRIGNYYRAGSYSTAAGPDERSYLEPFCVGGREASYSNNGDHMVVTFNIAPRGPLYYDELIYGAALTALTDTTTFPADMVKLWARAEIYDFLWRSETRQQKRAENGVALPSVYRPLRNAAYKSAQWSRFEPEMVTVAGRR